MQTAKVFESTAEFRIWAGSWSDYNAGELHGVWIDCDGKDAEDLQAEVNAMLRASRWPNVNVECPECEGEGCDHCKGSGFVPSAEEWGIFDFEGFGNLIGENSSLEQVALIVEEIEAAREPEALLAYAQELGDIESAARNFDDAFCGEWDSFRAYVEETFTECNEVPEHLEFYLDWDAIARDWGYDHSAIDAPRGVYVFRDM